jgi:hypothetical protein
MLDTATPHDTFRSRRQMPSSGPCQQRRQRAIFIFNSKGDTMSVEQLPDAPRPNHSTGPKTPEGKVRCRLKRRFHSSTRSVSSPPMSSRLTTSTPISSSKASPPPAISSASSLNLSLTTSGALSVPAPSSPARLPSAGLSIRSMTPATPWSMTSSPKPEPGIGRPTISTS